MKKKEPVKIRDDPIYFLKWDKKEVAKLLEQSEIPCSILYIATGFAKGQETLGPVKDVYAVKNKDDFLDGTFDQLLLRTPDTSRSTQ